MNLNLSGKKVLVSGGTKGIGRAVTMGFANEGADVAVFASRDTEKNPVRELVRQGKNAEFYQVDVSDEKAVKENIEKVLEDFGTIDVLASVAGIIGEYQPVTKITFDNLSRVMNVNFKGCVSVVREVAKHMVPKRSGSIVVISSTIVLNPSYSEACYRASKCAVHAFAETAALELACYGIRVNCVAPGFTNSPNSIGVALQMLEDNPELKTKLLQDIPMGRYGEPEDVAPAVLFLASDASGFITGATLHVDGGFTLRPLALKTPGEIREMNK